MAGFKFVQTNTKWMYQKTYPVVIRDDEDCFVGSLGHEYGFIGAVKEQQQSLLYSVVLLNLISWGFMAITEDKNTHH